MKVKGPILVCILLLLAAATLVPMPVRACSLVGPVTLVGYLVIYDAQTQQERRITFDQVGIDSLCQIANSVDISGYAVMLRLLEGVRLFDLNGAMLKDLRLGDAYYFPPRLDGNFVYYLDGSGSLLRLNADTFLRETVISGLARGESIVGLEVTDGIVAWLSTGLSGNRLSVFDSVRSTYLVENGELPDALGNQTGQILRLIAFFGSSVTFLKSSQEVYVHDFQLNTTKLLLRVDDYIGTVAHDNARLVYSSEGRLYLLDASINETVVLMEDFVGSNLRMHGNVLVYDFYRTYPGIPGFLLAFGVATSVAVVVGVVLLLRRRGH